MNKKTSWTITLLLTALVPFATGCDDKEACGYARNLQHSANNLSELIQIDVRTAQDRSIDWHTPNKYSLQCTKELELAATMNNEKTQKFLKEKKEDFCDEKGRSLGLCDAFTSVRNGVNGYKTSDDTDLGQNGAFKLLQMACQEQAAGGRLDIGMLNNLHSKPLKADVEALQQIFMGSVIGNAKKLADNVCKGLEPQAIVAAAVTVRAGETPGNYQTPISYTGPVKPAAPAPQPQPQPPSAAPLPGEVPRIPTAAPATVPATCPTALAADGSCPK